MSVCEVILKAIYSLFRLAISIIFWTPGMITLLPQGIILKRIAEKHRIEALKGSVVKVRGVDVVATKKILFTIKWYPVNCLLTNILFFFIVSYFTDWAFMNRVWITFIFMILNPVYHYFCVRQYDGVGEHW